MEGSGAEKNHWVVPRELWRRWKADQAPGRLWSREKSQDSQEISRICRSAKRKVQDSLNCHQRKGGKGGEKADLPAKKLEVSPKKTARQAEQCLGRGHATNRAIAWLYGPGEAG